MKRFYIISFVMLILSAGFVPTAHSVPCPNKAHIYKGPAFFADQEMDSLTISGSGDLQSSTVTGTTLVYGNFKARQCRFQTIEVKGHVKLKDSSFTQAKVMGAAKLVNVKATGDLEIIGFLDVQGSHLQDVMVRSDKIIVEDSTIRSITIKYNQKSGAPQKVYLNGETVVGKIIFERGDGVVLVSGDSSKTEAIEGGKVERY